MTEGGGDFMAEVETLVAHVQMGNFRAQRVPLIKPISLNSIFAHGSGGRYKTAAYRAWRREQAYAFVLNNTRRHGYHRCSVILRPVCSKIDTDNVNKAYLDAFVECGILADDNAILACLTIPTDLDRGYALIIPEIEDAGEVNHG